MLDGLLRLFETLFRRRFWVVNLAFITLISLLVALTVNGFVASQLAPLSVVAPRLGPPAEEDPYERSRDDNALAISELLQRDEPEDEGPVVEVDLTPEEPEEEPDTGPVVPEGDCLQSSVAAILVGTMVNPDPRWSFGIVQDQAANRTVLIRVGMDVGGAEVTHIGRNRVYVNNAGYEECLKPGEEPNAALAAARAAEAEEEEPASRSSSRASVARAETPSRSRPAEPTRSSVDLGDLRSSIRRTSPTSYEIERDAVDAALENTRALQSQAPEFQQNFEDGRPSGIRLSSIPSGSIFSAIGIRQGDVITAVNGNRVTTPQRAMELYDALREESHVEVTVLRRGRQRTLTYDIR